MAPVLAFDMNGTLLDMSVLDPFFSSRMGSTRVRHEWFLELIGLANVATITKYYEPFPKLAIAALKMVGTRYSVKIDTAAEEEFETLSKKLCVFPDVREALDKLQDAKFRMIVLTNSPEQSARTLLDANDLLPYLESVISAEKFQVFKPNECVYQGAAQALKIPATELMLVAAHPWDTTGAMRAGCQAAFIERPGESLPLGAPKPAICAKDLNDLVEQLCAVAKK